MATMVSRRARASRGLLAWTVVRAVVSRVHGLEHVQRLPGTALADHDPVGAHPQGVDQEIARGDLALALQVLGPRLEADQVLLAELELGGVLDGDDPLLFGDEAREDVEQGGLSRSGSSRDQDVESRPDRRLQGQGHLRGDRPEADQILVVERVRREATDREGGAVQGKGRNDRIDATSVLEAGVHHRVRLVDPPPHLGHDALDDPHQVGVVAEPDGGLLELARSLHVHLLGAVDEDVADRRVAEQRLDRPQAEHLVPDVAQEAVALVLGECDSLLGEDPLGGRHHLLAVLLLGHVVALGEVEDVEEPVVNAGLELLVLAVPRGLRPARLGLGLELGLRLDDLELDASRRLCHRGRVRRDRGCDGRGRRSRAALGHHRCGGDSGSGLFLQPIAKRHRRFLTVPSSRSSAMQLATWA